jgi:hypothetical protein
LPFLRLACVKSFPQRTVNRRLFAENHGTWRLPPSHRLNQGLNSVEDLKSTQIQGLTIALKLPNRIACTALCCCSLFLSRAAPTDWMVDFTGVSQQITDILTRSLAPLEVDESLGMLAA